MNTCNLPVIYVSVNGFRIKGLIDTGCTQTMVLSKFCKTFTGGGNVLAFNGSEASYIGRS